MRKFRISLETFMDYLFGSRRAYNRITPGCRFSGTSGFYPAYIPTEEARRRYEGV